MSRDYYSVCKWVSMLVAELMAQHLAHSKAVELMVQHLVYYLVCKSVSALANMTAVASRGWYLG